MQQTNALESHAYVLCLRVTKCIPHSLFESFALQLRSILLLFTMDIGGCFVLFCLFFILSHSHTHTQNTDTLAHLFRFCRFGIHLQITRSPRIHKQTLTHTCCYFACTLYIVRCHPVWKINQSHALCI